MGQPVYIARKGEDADFKALTVDSLTINTATIAAGAVVLADDEKITLGSSLDVTIEWDTAATPDELQLVPLADDYVIGLGKSAATQLAFDIRWLANEANAASYLFFDASANLVYTTGVDLQFKDADLLVFGSGAGAAGDVTLQWDVTNLLMSATADDSVFEIGDSGATQKSFDVKIYGEAANGADYLFWDASASALKFVGDSRLDFTGNTVLAANTDGGIIKGGTSGAGAIVQDVADTKFVSFYFDDGATSGEARGIYDCLYVTGAGGSGTALRALCDVTDVTAVDARGAHISLSFGSTGKVSGSGQALTLTTHIANQATQSGSLSALTTEIYSEGATSDPSGAVLSCWRASANGDGTGKADVETDCALIHVDSGFTEGDGNMVAKKGAAACPNVTESIRIRLPDGVRYLYAGTSALTA